MATALSENAPQQAIDIMRVGGHSRRQAAFIEKAHEQDVINRTTLMMSYVFGFYRPMMMSGVNKDIFENLQGALERHTEILTASYENKSIPELIADETQVVNATRSAANVRAALLDAASSWDDYKINDAYATSKSKKAASSSSSSAAAGTGGGKKKGKISRLLSRSKSKVDDAVNDTHSAVVESIAAASAHHDTAQSLSDEVADSMTPEEIEIQMAIRASMADQ